jgi:hypothetical protein
MAQKTLAQSAYTLFSDLGAGSRSFDWYELCDEARQFLEKNGRQDPMRHEVYGLARAVELLLAEESRFCRDHDC